MAFLERGWIRNVHARWWVLLALTLQSALALAAPPAVVEMLQAPAWLDRRGIELPLAAGMELRHGDVLRTGAGARAYVRLAEGSLVKLGESTRFVLYSRSLRPERYFRGALDVVTGAFRFTTSRFQRVNERDLAIRVGTATLGIRGTDLWGRSAPDGDMVALLEGRIEISRAGELTELSQPMTWYDAPRGQPATVRNLDPEVLRGLARQTEILAGDGAARARGPWRVSLGRVPTQGMALELYDRLRYAGFAVQIRPRMAAPEVLEVVPDPAAQDGSAAEIDWHYELQLTGFPDRGEAVAAAARVEAITGLEARASRRASR